MIGLQSNKIKTVPFEEVFSKQKVIDKNLYELAHILAL